ncbi:MAG: hypothetical protein GY862_03195 [Gammaproteobacteria bacterium]|nr:hypothetical protein [Gammaproteobacteria bacterium]
MSEETDAAWVSIETPFPPEWLQEFLSDPERLYRINSLLEIHRWSEEGPGRFRLEASNLSNGKTLQSDLRVKRLNDGLRIDYSGLLKTSTIFRIEPKKPEGSLLTITDDYSGTPEAERRTRLDEVDRSLMQWGRDLHAYLHAWKRWSRLPLWPWYMTRVWQPMKPSARRITRWIFWISAGELAAFLLVLAIFLA